MTLHGHLRLPGQHLYFRRWRLSGGKGRLLCLHGAGAGGEETFAAMVNHLHGWEEVLAPDLRGAGRSRDPDGGETPFDMNDVVADLAALLDAGGWDDYDLCGYSMGGLAAMLLHRVRPARRSCLIEPALFARIDPGRNLTLRLQLHRVAGLLRRDAGAGLHAFLELLLPGRDRRSDERALARLGHRPLGLANALDAVWVASRQLDRMALVAEQPAVLHVVGDRAHEDTLALCRLLAGAHPGRWQCRILAGDHALPFSRPRALAGLLDEWGTAAHHPG